LVKWQRVCEQVIDPVLFVSNNGLTAGMMVSTGKFTTEWSWRLPLFIQVVPAALNVLLVWFAPESWVFSHRCVGLMI
jgi:hypothetical protein